MENIPDELQEQNCAVCLQNYEHPTKLPCGHIFCFLCAKGVALHNRTCAMCRNVIPNDYLNNPVVLPQQKRSEENHNQDYQWYYEGGNGWWKYDKRSNAYLEETYNKGDKEGCLLLAGNLYRIDFEKNVQVRMNDQRKTRKIRRDTPFLPSKGIAGIRLNSDSQPESQIEIQEENSQETDSDVEIVQNEAIIHVDLTNDDDSISEEFHGLSVTTREEDEYSSVLPETENA